MSLVFKGEDSEKHNSETNQNLIIVLTKDNVTGLYFKEIEGENIAIGFLLVKIAC